MDLLRVVLAWLLVWVLGIVLVRRLYGVAARDTAAPVAHPAWIAGTGFLAGAFVLTLLMRALSLAGIAFGVSSIGIALLVAALLLALPDARALVRRERVPVDATWRATAGAGTRKAAVVLWWLLLAWLVVRAGLLLAEVVRQPLFPWDAWTQWGTKARVWFEMKRMVPFVSAAEWLQSAGGAYYDAAPHYPATVPLWQVWSSVALGRWDDALMNVPWWAAGVALALLLYGFLRDAGLPPLFALVGTWMIVSMPILETHVALAGYADLPLACYFAGAALAGYRAWRRRSLADGLLAIAFAAALPMIKNPGWVWLAVLVPGIVVALVPRYGLRLVVIGWVAAIALVLLLGRFETTLFNYHLHLDLKVPWHGLGEAYLSFANWHLLFFALPAVLIVARKWLVAPDFAPLTAVVCSGALFLLLGFSLTSAAIWVEDQSTVNRATLHLAPLLGVWLLLLMHRAWREAVDTATEGQAPATPAASTAADA